MLERSPYPLLTLKLLGTLCPCLEKEEDGAARRAAWSLSSTHVRWHRSNNNTAAGNENNNGNAMTFIKGIFKSSSDGGLGGGTTESVDGATLSIVDARGGPQLVMSPPPQRATEIGKKRVPLRMIKTIRLAGSGIDIILDNNDTVLRFDVLQPLQFPQDEDIDEEEGPTTFDDADDATRNDTMVQLQLLVEWERRRQTRLLNLGIAEDESAEDVVDEFGNDDGQQSSSPKRGGMIADKARKVQHFAQREIEMKKQKRDREARKAKYVQGAGGLKYTAIAMANRS